MFIAGNVVGLLLSLNFTVLASRGRPRCLSVEYSYMCIVSAYILLFSSQRSQIFSHNV